ncbi:MAG: ribosome maturation factor RimP [Nitrosomonas sp.]|nr:MAG: ribosome maturation factor RimP [Nitrosomonas sp.]
MELDNLLEPTLASMGYELVEVEQLAHGKLLRIFVDKDGGVSIDDCVLISNHLSKLLAVENIDYSRLEVSSPGMDRRLKKEADFYRFREERVKLKLRVALQGRKNFEGILLEVNNGKLKLEVEGKELEIELSNLEKARLVPKF